MSGNTYREAAASLPPKGPTTEPPPPWEMVDDDSISRLTINSHANNSLSTAHLSSVECYGSSKNNNCSHGGFEAAVSLPPKGPTTEPPPPWEMVDDDTISRLTINSHANNSLSTAHLSSVECYGSSKNNSRSGFYRSITTKLRSPKSYVNLNDDEDDTEEIDKKVEGNVKQKSIDPNSVSFFMV